MHASELTTIENLTERATKNVSDIVSTAIEYTSANQALVIYDTECALAVMLLEAYKRALPNATFLDFNILSKDEVIAAFDACAPKDLVVLIQTTDFRLNEFRIRIHLFKNKLKVIDHMHLSRCTSGSWETYIDALAYDKEWYRVIGPKLKTALEKCSELRIVHKETELRITGGVESPKLNIGDYSGMENVGGSFPIGEVFTEAKDLSHMNGSLMIYAFAGKDFNVAFYEPFRIDITDGILVGWGENAPQSFIDIVNEIREHERTCIREIGFGLNRAITPEKHLKDITAFERIYGMHFSLGEKHTIFKKEGIKADKTRYHVDLFPVVTQVFSDEGMIMDDSQYVL